MSIFFHDNSNSLFRVPTKIERPHEYFYLRNYLFVFVLYSATLVEQIKIKLYSGFIFASLKSTSRLYTENRIEI